MSLAWGERTFVMGVINLTPDSFSDGGCFLASDRALSQASAQLAQGADVLDLGAQSTRPGAIEVGPQQEMARLLEPLQLIRKCYPQALISVDTFIPAVAEAALANGANWVNDVRGCSERRDTAMFQLVASACCPYVLTHSRGTSAEMDSLTSYHDVVSEVREQLLFATDQAVAAGVRPEQLIWDPGLGFAKTTEQNLQLLRGLTSLRAEGFPLLIGPSRKRFIGVVLDEPRAKARLWGTAAVCAQAICAGVDLLRVHDVGPIAKTSRMVDSIVRAPSGSFTI